MLCKSFLKICSNNQVGFKGVSIEKSYVNLNTKISIHKNDSNNIDVEIFISNSLSSSSTQVKRVIKCYKFWIPYCITIFHKINNSFSLKINACDIGVEGFLSMTSENQNNIIPDEYSMIESLKLNSKIINLKYNNFSRDWLNRKPLIYWRGSTTGSKITSLDKLKRLLRVQTCFKYKNHSAVDLKITNIVQNEIPKKIVKNWLRQNSIAAGRVLESSFKAYKYHPDIPGNNTSCGSWGVIRKYLNGILIFRPNHKSFMFYDRYLFPWINYIPVKDDFSDLFEKYTWAQKNQYQALYIAWQGYLMAKSYLSNIENSFMENSLDNIELI